MQLQGSEAKTMRERAPKVDFMIHKKGSNQFFAKNPEVEKMLQMPVYLVLKGVEKLFATVGAENTCCALYIVFQYIFRPSFFKNLSKIPKNGAAGENLSKIGSDVAYLVFKRIENSRKFPKN